MTPTAHDVVPFQGRFPSWEVFDVARKAHCEKTYTMYVCRNSVQVAVANRRRKLQVPDTWVYDRKIYVCTHGYKRVSRSSGSRPRQNVRYTDCKARFTACVVSEPSEDGREVLFIKVTGQHLVHTDHPVTLEQWRMYSQNRAAVIEHPFLTHEAELMRRIGSNKRAAREHIETLTGKVCTMKDMHNLYTRLKKRDNGARPEGTTRAGPQQASTGSSLELSRSQSATSQLNSGASSQRVEPVLQRFVDADVENHVSILSGDDGSNEAICLASRAMKEHFQVFPELLVLDFSMVTQLDVQPGQKLHGFLSMDALGNAKPVFVARSLPMSSSLIRRACQDFKRTHPKWVETKVLVISRLLSGVIQVLTREFPHAQVLLCQFHMLKLLNELLVDSKQPVRIQGSGAQAATIRRVPLDQDRLHHLIQQLVFAHSESRYNEAKDLLMRQLSTEDRNELVSMFERNWEPYRALWVSYARTEQFDFSSFFTKGMNSFWEPMKSAFRHNFLSPASAATTDTSDSTTTTIASTHPPALNAPFRPVVSAADNQVCSQASNELGVVPLTMALRTTDSTRSGNSLAKCTSEVLMMMKFIESEWTSKMLILELTKPVAMDHCDPLLHLMINCLSGFAVDLVSSQLTIQSARANGSVTVTKPRAPRTHQCSNNAGANETPASPGLPVSESTVRWLDKMTREKHILERDGSACDCDFFSLYQLPCRHLIWYEVTALQHKQLSVVAVGQRWFLRSFRVPKLSSQRESNEIEYHLL